MILITNATGFIGRALVRRLAEEQLDVRCLLRPFWREQRLPAGIPVSTVSAGADDLPALRTAMQDITAIIHLTGEDDPGRGRMLRAHAQDTVNLVEAAQEAGVGRLVYLSRLGADRTSAYPLFRVMGEAEMAVRESELETTVLQGAITYGPEDAFTNVLAMLAKVMPFIVPLPQGASSRFQPLWVGDLVGCIVATLGRPDLVGQTVPLGGPEYLTLEELVVQVLDAVGEHKRLVRVRAPLLRIAAQLLDVFLLCNPVPPRWLDVVAVGSATDLNTVQHWFGFAPRRFAECTDYLRHDRPWRRDLIRFVFGRW